MRPTLEDVSKLAGVSTATVSRVLNAPDRVRQNTRKQVQAAIAELGYTPHFGARALASNRTATVGAVIPTMENAIFARGLQAMQEELTQAGHTLLVATSNYDADREAEQIHTLLGRGIDALVLIGDARDPALHHMLEDRGVPFVLVWSWRPDSPWPCIGFDNAVAAEAMARHVLAQGHRHIAMIAGVTDGNDRAAARLSGVRKTLAGAGLDLVPGQTLLEAEYTINAGRTAAQELLAQTPKPSAIVCGNDVLAAGAMAGIRDLGLSIPGDVSVTGFDDIDLAQILSPGLTTVHVPHRRMGQAAAQQLLARCVGGAGPESVAFDTGIVDRGSLAPPPG